MHTNHSTDIPHASPTGSRTARASNAIAVLAGCFSVFGEVMLRRRFGSRFFEGSRTAAPLALLPIFAGIWSEVPGNAGWLFLLWALYIVRCIAHRIGVVAAAWRARRRGYRPIPCHSRYNGEPLLRRVLPRLSEASIKRFVEPALMLGVGLPAMLVAPAAGWYLVWTALGMKLESELLHGRDRRAMLDLADAAIEAEMLAERFHEHRGDGDRRNCRRRP
ncbi:MAG: hypothetical protein AB7K52_07020 [Phycisphaerales bacterium]